MRVTTLKASADRLDGLSYYAGLAEDRGRPGLGRGPVDYYLDPDEPPESLVGGAVGVRSASMAWLPGRICGRAGRPPAAAPRLGRRFGDTSARGFDATFSAPKSVSVLWALSPESWVRAAVLAAHDAAVDAALGWFECHGAVTRRGTDGVFQVDTQGLTAALFRQHTSRTIDPQLHTHAVISAKVQDPTGRWLSLDARFLKYQQRTIGWIYDAALRAELTNRLGVTWAEPGDGARDLTCIPAEVNAEFSTRTTQVDAKLTELVRRWSYDHDGADPDARTIAGLQRAAVVASRPAKGHGFDPSVLRLGWEEHARAIGFDPDHLTADELTARQPEASRVPDEDLIGKRSCR